MTKLLELLPAETKSITPVVHKSPAALLTPVTSTEDIPDSVNTAIPDMLSVLGIPNSPADNLLNSTAAVGTSNEDASKSMTILNVLFDSLRK